MLALSIAGLAVSMSGLVGIVARVARWQLADRAIPQGRHAAWS